MEQPLGQRLDSATSDVPEAAAHPARRAVRPRRRRRGPISRRCPPTSGRARTRTPRAGTGFGSGAFLLSGVAILFLLLTDRLVAAHPGLGRAAEPPSSDPDVSLLRRLHARRHPPDVSLHRVHGLRARAYLRPRHPELRRLDAGSDGRPRGVAGPGGARVAVLYEVLHRFPRAWPASSGAVGDPWLFLVIGVADRAGLHRAAVQPVTPLDDARIREPILRLAHANGIATDRVYVQDASRQTTRISALRVGTARHRRIVLNDNLLRRASLPEIEAVMGHEMGHYVLAPRLQFILFFALVAVGGIRAAPARCSRGPSSAGAMRWGVRASTIPPGFRCCRSSSGVPLRAHPGPQYRHPEHGGGGRHLRPQCRAPAGRLRHHRAQARRIPEARPGPARGAAPASTIPAAVRASAWRCGGRRPRWIHWPGK